MLLRVLTVNIHKGFALLNRRFVLPALRDAIRAVKADVVFLQEVQGNNLPRDGRGVDAFEGSHYEFLADEVWPQFAYGRNAVYPEGHHGNAVLSKYPILRHENHDVSIDGHEGRGLLHCTLLAPAVAAPVHAICVHLGLREEHRRRQIELLRSTIDARVPDGEPLIVAGDFNDWRSRAHRILEGCTGLREVFVHAYGRAARTFPAGLPLLALDRIYVRDARAHAPYPLPRAPWARLSDHAPLAAEVGL